VTRELREAGSNLREAGADVRRAGMNVREAGEDVLEAGQAGVAAARHVVGTASEQLEEAAEAARKRAGAVTVQLRSRLRFVPALLREGVRRGVEALEATGVRALVSVIQAGTNALGATAGYVREIVPRRRVQRQALEQLVVEQLAWAHVATEAYERAVGDTEDRELRMQLVRFKLETIQHAETLIELLREIGGRVPSEERALPPPRVPGQPGNGARGAAAARQGLAHALTVAVQSAEGWRALYRIAIWAEADRIAEAILRAAEAVGSQPAEQVEFLRRALLEKTVEAVLA